MVFCRLRRFLFDLDRLRFHGCGIKFGIDFHVLVCDTSVNEYGSAAIGCTIWMNSIIGSVRNIILNFDWARRFYSCFTYNCDVYRYSAVLNGMVDE